MSGAVPAFTIIEDAVDNEPRARQAQQPELPAWMSMYQSNITSPPGNSPLLPFVMPEMVSDYPDPYSSLTAPAPQMPSSYEESLAQNANVLSRNRRFNLPSTPPEPLPSYPPFPYTETPYGTPYASNGYSQFDGSLAMNAGIPQFYGGPGVPAASWPALQDARDSPSMPMTPYTLAFIAEKKYKEGFQAGKHNHQTSCQESFAHSLSCPVCKAAASQSIKMYQMGMSFLALVIIFLFILLFRHKK
jgi:hypothetical protein